MNFRIPLFAFLFTLLFNSAYAACPQVNAAFTTSVTNICGPGATSISFTNTSTGANSGAGSTSYEWFLNGVSFDVTNGMAAPSNSSISAVGTYTYMLIASDNPGGCSDTATVTVTIHPTPSSSFTFNPNNACAGTNVIFTNTSTGTSAGATTTWNFGDGTNASTTNASHAYAAGGTYNVSLTITNFPGCSGTSTQTVTALDIPNVTISGDDGDGNITNCLLPGDPTTSETVVFTNNTTGAVSYSWDFGDGTTSTAQSPSHTYTAYGTFNVTMTATGANGCTSSQTIVVVFEKYVSASMTLDITEYSGCLPHTLSTLNNLSVNANTYTWNFGDGTGNVVTTSPTPPSHTYNTAGTFTISLSAANSCNTANATISPIVIVNGPTANFSTSLPGNLGCAPQSVNFTNFSSNVQPANNYQWSMGNGNSYTTTTTPPSQSYPVQGTYPVTLIAGNGCGYDTLTQNVVIDSIPVADIVANPLEGCTPLAVDVTNNSYGNSISYYWYIDGFYTYSSQNIPQQVFTAPVGNATQNHTISLTVTNHCGTDNDAETIIVHPAVTALFSMSATTICEGSAITFTDGSYGDSLSWSWNFGEGTTANVQGPHTITYPVAGTYPVQLIVSGYCGVDTLIQNVTVNAIPVADISSSADSGCAPLTVSFINNSTAGGTYNWSFTGGTPATSASYTPADVVYNTAGTYTVIQNVTVLGCSNSDTLTIEVNPVPVASFTATPASGCSPLDVLFVNTSPVTAGDTYSWDLGNGTTSALQDPPSQVYIANSTDSVYTVSLTVTSLNGCSAIVTSAITVHPLPVADYSLLPDTVCATTPVAFLNNSSGAISFQWDFGDGNTSTAMSPSHSYNTQGTFTTQLIASTVFGCTDTLQLPVVVDSIPAADFSFSIECVGDSTQFTDLSTGSVTDWSWNFGDGSPASTVVSPAHLFAAAGSYNVILTTTNPAGCIHSVSQLVTVNSVPVATFTASSFCFGQTTQFTDGTSGVPVGWNWDFGDGNTSAIQNPTNIYSATGTYNVTLIASAGSGCSDTVTNIITITDIPTADFTFTSVCTNDTTYFTSASLGTPDMYVWDFGNGITDNTNNPSPSIIYNAPGTYNVMLTAGYAASGCTHSVTIPVDAFPRTAPAFTSNAPCLGFATNFSDASTGTPVSWSWNFGDGDTSTLQNPSHTYTAFGSYDVTLITTNSFNCTDTLISTITVNPLPVADFTNTVVCDGFSTAFTDLSTDAVQWSWDFGDGSAINNQQNPFHLFPSNGTYTVELIAFNIFGCSDTTDVSVTVNPNPVAGFISDTACFSYTSFFTDTSSDAISWSWTFGDGNSDTIASPSHTYSAPGNYSVQQIVTNVFGCSDTLALDAVILPQPEAGFVNTTVCAGQTVQFTDTTIGAPNSWSWDFGDGNSSSQQNPIYTFSSGGIYNILFIAGNSAGCFDTTAVPVEVYTIPDAAFTADTVCLFNITGFTDLTTDIVPIQSWYYDFSDGNSSFAQNPTYIFQSPGIFNVSLTVTNINGCDTTITQPVVVNDIPAADFTADTVCLGAATTFTDLSTGVPSSWTWSFGDGTTATGGPVITHTYASAGSYLVTLAVSGTGNNCSDMTFGIVDVSTDAVAGMIVPDTVCAGEFFNYTDNSTITTGTIISSYWDMGDGTIYTSDGLHSYVSPGVYYITHTVTSSGGCSSTVTDTIAVMSVPVPEMNTGTSCEGIPFAFTDNTISSAPLAAWNWDFGDGNTDTVQNPVHTYGNPGGYFVTLTVTNIYGCSGTASQNHTVYETPVAGFTFDVVCWGEPVSFTDASTVVGTTIGSYSWDFGDGNSSTLADVQHAYTVYNDTFQVSLIITTTEGCSDTIIGEVNTLPLVTFNYYPDVVNGCAPLVVQFTDSTTSFNNTTIVGWVWDFGDGLFAFAQNPTHEYPDAGQYYAGLTVTTSDGCTFSDTLDYPVTVYPQPVANFSAAPFQQSIYTPEITVTDFSSGALFWEYYFGDGYGSNQSNPVHNYSEPGEYTITQMVTNEFGCRDTIERNIVIYEEYTFYSPNTITPDGDGLNDIFYVTGTGIIDIDIMIFDRWGELLYRSSDMLEGWDATYRGVGVKPDVYIWKTVVTYEDLSVQDYYGHVTVLR